MGTMGISRRRETYQSPARLLVSHDLVSPQPNFLTISTRQIVASPPHLSLSSPTMILTEECNLDVCEFNI